MNEMERDILNNPELRKTPYTVPEGYFDSLRKEVSGYVRLVAVKVSLWQKLAPLAAVAAMFIIMVTAGTFFLRSASPEEDITQEDYIVFAGNYSDFGIYEEEYDEQYADAGVNADDIIEYLIYTGVSEDIIELSKE